MPKLAAEQQALKFASVAAVLAIAGLWAGNAAAQPKEAGDAEGPRRGPPPEALAACKSLAAGKECTVTLGSNTIQGTCWAPEGKPLACRPAGAPGPDAGKPAPASK
jgi:hypothetical protein